MSGFCYETHPLGAITRRPSMAMDAAPTSGGNLIEALQKFAAAELTREQTARLNNLIESNGNPRGAVAGAGSSPFAGSPKTRAPDVDPEAQERAFRFLKTRGFTEDDITHLRGLYGMETDPAKRAMDSAIRQTDRLSRNAASYSARFPEAAHIKLG